LVLAVQQCDLVLVVQQYASHMYDFLKQNVCKDK